MYIRMCLSYIIDKVHLLAIIFTFICLHFHEIYNIKLSTCHIKLRADLIDFKLHTLATQ